MTGDWPLDNELTPVPVPMGIQLNGSHHEADAQMLMAVGAVARASAQLDLSLRFLYCALVGSKYAAVTAAGQTTEWLMQSSRALADGRQDRRPDQLEALQQILTAIDTAKEKRNRYMHDMWATAGDGSPELLRSRRGKHELTSRPVTLAEVVGTATELMRCGSAIQTWCSINFPHTWTLEAQLRNESAPAED